MVATIAMLGKKGDDSKGSNFILQAERINTVLDDAFRTMFLLAKRMLATGLPVAEAEQVRDDQLVYKTQLGANTPW